MGRKPNGFVAEFFYRGQKLQDSSNRYEHTCKACGQEFLKGRTDVLQTHTLKKCPSISSVIRQKALDLLSSTVNNQNGTYNQTAVLLNEVGSGTPISSNSGPNMSPLDALAEVSRRQLDGHKWNVVAQTTSRKRKRGQTAEEAQLNGAIIDALQEMDAFNSGQEATTLQSLTRDPQHTATGSAAPALAPSGQSSEVTHCDGNPLNFDHTGSSSADSPSAEVHASPPDSTYAMFQLEGYTSAKPACHPTTNNSGPELLPPSFLHEWTIFGGDVPKLKTRAKFDIARRKEVYAIRKQGACIRCRMLKKSCSDETPCSACRSVEQARARLWKSPCMRARIADEFDFYHCGLHTIMAFHKIEAVKTQVTFDSLSVSLYASHDPQHLERLELPIVRARNVQLLSTEPLLLTQVQDERTISIELIDVDGDGIPQKFDAYIRHASQFFLSKETSPVIGSTVHFATGLAHQRQDPLLLNALELWISTQMLVDQDFPWHLTLAQTPSSASPTSSPVAPSSNHQDITSADSPITYSLIIQQLHSYVEKRCTHHARTLTTELERRLLQRQQGLNSHFETFLATIILLNCMERMCWLFSSWIKQDGVHDVGQEAVDIAATAAAAAAAAITIDIPVVQEEQHDASSPEGLESIMPIGLRQTTEETLNLPIPSAFDRHTWPLPKDPASFISKAPNLAGTITMLLKTRAVPPPMYMDSQGIFRADIRAINNASVATRNEKRMSATTNNDGHDELLIDPEIEMEDSGLHSKTANPTAATDTPPVSSEIIAQWLDDTGICVAQLEEARTAGTGCRGWDLRYIGRLLLECVDSEVTSAVLWPHS